MQKKLFLQILSLPVLILLFPNLCFSGDLTFHSESVFVEIRLPDTVRVHGMYCFINRSENPLTKLIYYPFPVDSINMYPHEITIKRDGFSGPVSFVRSEKGISFSVNMDKKGTVKYRITYSQRVIGHSGYYILKTTQNWNEALTRSDLEISIPTNNVLKYVSYNPDTVVCSGNQWVYRFGFNNFMPQKDLTFEWE